MTRSHDAKRCREAAAFFGQRAAGTDDAPLRNSYLSLAADYERLAQVLDRQEAPHLLMLLPDPSGGSWVH